MKRIFLITTIILFSMTLLCGQRTFENKKFGFSMEEPKDWVVTTNEELKKNLEKFDLTDEKLAEMAKTGKGKILLIAYYKYELDKKDGLIPKVQVEVLPHNTKNFEQFKTAITNGAKSYKNFFDEFEFIQEPQEIVIAGIKSIVFSGKFSMKTVYDQRLKVRARVYAIPYKNYFFQINMVDGQVEEDNSKLFDELIKTVKIGN